MITNDGRTVCSHGKWQAISEFDMSPVTIIAFHIIQMTGQQKWQLSTFIETYY